jgi:hypothetical protein
LHFFYPSQFSVQEYKKHQHNDRYERHRDYFSYRPGIYRDKGNTDRDKAKKRSYFSLGPAQIKQFIMKMTIVRLKD